MTFQYRYTLYASHGRALDLAKDTIRSTYRKLQTFANDPQQPPANDQPGSWDKWLVQARSEDSVRNASIPARSPTSPPSAAELARDDEIKRYNAAVAAFRTHQSEMLRLQQAGETFQASPNNTSQYRYLLDEETGRYVSIAQQIRADSLSRFLGPKQIRLADQQTDGLRIWKNNVVVDRIEVVDKRIYTDIAHRDAVQLIPPPRTHNEFKQADQMAGAILENVTIQRCTIRAPQAALQGIFASDGLCRRITLHQNDISTAAGHFISLSGVLDGCKITGNTLRQTQDSIPQISLFPARLGGNIADDGIIYILSFANTSRYRYGPVETSGNRFFDKAGKALLPNIKDMRRDIPSQQARIAAGLDDFNFENYSATYSTWTLNDFKTKDTWGYKQLLAWLTQRCSEYSTRKRWDTDRQNNWILPTPNEEQSKSVLPALQRALSALQANKPEYLKTRLADLPDTPVRSFIIKRIAVRNGKLRTLSMLSEPLDNYRRANLKWLLPELTSEPAQAAAPAMADGMA